MPTGEPLRSCLGCRQVKPKGELLRFVLDPERNLVPDLLGKLPGRGAYTCWCSHCLRQAVDKRQFSRTFRGAVQTEGADALVETVVLLLSQRIASYIALANKAGAVISGTDPVLTALRKRSPIGLVLLADDMSHDISEKLAGVAAQSGVECQVLFAKERLGSLLGKELRSAVALQQGGFVDSIRRELWKYRNFVDGGRGGR